MKINKEKKMETMPLLKSCMGDSVLSLFETQKDVMEVIQHTKMQKDVMEQTKMIHTS